MKSLNEYLTESVKQYIYRVKIAGELPKENLNKFKDALGKFDLQKCTAPKKTPIQSDPAGFPGLQNEEVNIFDITLDYPASTQQVIEMAKIAGISPANVVVVDKAFNDSMNAELEGVEDGTRLDTPEYPNQTSEQKAASDAYADSYKKAAEEFAGEANMNFEIAGEDSASVQYNTDNEAAGNDSPMSNVKRPKIKDLIK